MPTRFDIRRAIVAAVLCLSAVHPSAGAELKPGTGERLPPFELKTLAGETHRLADYRGKVVLVNFWATWCEPCREEMPSMEALRRKLAGQPFAVLAVNVDEPEARIRKFLGTMDLRFTVLLDPERRLTRRWNVRVLPASFVLDAEGRVRYTVVGEVDWAAPAVTARIAELLSAR